MINAKYVHLYSNVKLTYPHYHVSAFGPGSKHRICNPPFTREKALGPGDSISVTALRNVELV